MGRADKHLDGYKGFSKSFYVSRHDIEFIVALDAMLESKGVNWSSFVSFCLKYVVLDEGGEIFDGFQEHYKKIIETRLDETFVKYRSKKIKLSELIDSELLKENGFVKI